jgi:tripeptide aminopeptidase
METPEHTKDRQGFFHLHNMKGEVDSTKLQYIIRDHDISHFEARKEMIQKLANDLNDQYEKEIISVELKDQYFNMREKIEPIMHIVDTAEEAMEMAGIKAIIKPIRGGTDGSQLSFMGLPCPNIFAGGHNFHGRFEYVPVESMLKAIEVIVNITQLVAKKEE